MDTAAPGISLYASQSKLPLRASQPHLKMFLYTSRLFRARHLSMDLVVEEYPMVGEEGLDVEVAEEEEDGVSGKKYCQKISYYLLPLTWRSPSF